MIEGRAAFLRVGLLIVAGAAAVIGLAWFLGGSGIKQGALYETYFSESVQGLEVGVAVRYRGVSVGRVTEIGLVTAEYGGAPEATIDQATYRLVYVRYLVDSKRVGNVPDTAIAVKAGLRAKLASAGLTGVTYIELDFLDPNRNRATPVPWTPRGEYIPSVPTTLSRLEDAVKETLEQFNHMDLAAIVASANKVLNDLDRLVLGVEGQIAAADLSGLAADLKQTSQSLRTVAQSPEIGRFLAGSATAAEKLTQAIAQIPPLIAAVQGVTRRADGGVADTQQALVLLLRDLLAATANLRDMTDALRRDPAQILTGAPPPRQPGSGR